MPKRDDDKGRIERVRNFYIDRFQVNIENKDHVIFADQKTGPPQRATPARELGCRANPTYDIVLAHRRRDVEGDPSGQTK